MEWLTAVTSVFALGAAFWAALTARGVYRIEQARDDKAREQAERAQATRVFGWVAVAVDPASGEVVGRGMVIVNLSDAPVYSVEIFATRQDGQPEPRLRLTILPPGTFYVERREADRYHWGFPDEIEQLRQDWLIRPIMKKPTWQVSAMTYTDASERQWRRDGRGVLLRAGVELPGHPGGA